MKLIAIQQPERVRSEARKQDAAKTKKAKGEKQRKDAQIKVANARQASQKKRSNVFAAARAGDSNAVKKGIWEEQVDASGGEILPDHDEYVAHKPDDCKETLLHIAADKGDFELVEWLQSHSESLQCVHFLRLN